ncbi:MAG: beta-ketoacyl-[acyl-carrier-protein] synthase family protein [Victivallaceae bacterium]|nr:beta-ketoacyl-[acyl-carrier-protein] synthase family protein [Victivallaceae bacterium]
MKRVVITGLGIRTPLGDDVEAFCQALQNGQCAVRGMPEWDQYPEITSRVAATTPLDDAEVKSIPRSSRRSMGRLAIFAALAAKSAVTNAGLSEDELADGSAGCIIGSTMGSPDSILEAMGSLIENNSFSELSAMQFFKCVSHTAAMNVSNYLNLRGHISATSSACASSLQALGQGASIIATGQQKIMLCGGSEEVGISVTGSFDILYAASHNFNDQPKKASRPFDAERDGLVCGEGAGILVLEEYEHAKARGAHIYGEITGYATCGSGNHISQSDYPSIVRCIKNALQNAQCVPETIGYISAHATATVHGDAVEVAAIKEVFGDSIPMSSMKGHIGHTMGASGAIETIASLIMMRDGTIYPTINLDNVADDCQYGAHITTPTAAPFNAFIKNCFAFGGINAVLVCKKV